jgi:Transcriptional regulator, AbiEi antitoxin
MGRATDAATSDSLRGLASTFTHAQLRQAGISDRTLYRLRDTGTIQPIGHGLYRRTDIDLAADIDLLEIARRAPRATLCLTTALARHGLTDEIPAGIDVALPRGRHRPVTTAPVTWHLFDPDSFDIGRTDLILDEHTSIGLYGPQRSIIDAIRLRHREGPELGYIALKRWLGRPGSSPSELLATARHFPQAEKALREALEILL